MLNGPLAGPIIMFALPLASTPDQAGDHNIGSYRQTDKECHHQVDDGGVASDRSHGLA